MKKVIEFDQGEGFDNANLEDKIKKALLQEGYLKNEELPFCDKDFSLIIEVVERL